MPSEGSNGLIELIVFRAVQDAGAASVFANSVAILADAFPVHQRGLAIGTNQVAFVGGTLLGVLAGGLLAAINGSLIFLANVPFGAFAVAWSLLKLKDASPRMRERIDWLGNATFSLALVALLTGLTEALNPYHGQSLGWTNPLVAGALVLGVGLLLALFWIELRVPDPMFRVGLFRIRGFLFGNLASLFFSMARGGVQFLLVIWLQTVWLPLHSVPVSQMPLQAGFYTLPVTLAFAAGAPLGGALGDRHGARRLTRLGSGLVMAGCAAFLLLPAHFSALPFILASCR
jgi:MFS family permease